MTQTLAVDLNNDLYLTPAGLLAAASAAEAVAQNSAQAARTLLGEMVLAVDQGLPFFGTIWAGVPDVSRFEAALRRRLLAVQDVTGIVSLSSTLSGDRYAYLATLRTPYGPVTING